MGIHIEVYGSDSDESIAQAARALMFVLADRREALEDEAARQAPRDPDATMDIAEATFVQPSSSPEVYGDSYSLGRHEGHRAAEAHVRNAANGEFFAQGYVQGWNEVISGQAPARQSYAPDSGVIGESGSKTAFAKAALEASKTNARAIANNSFSGPLTSGPPVQVEDD